MRTLRIFMERVDNIAKTSLFGQIHLLDLAQYLKCDRFLEEAHSQGEKMAGAVSQEPLGTLMISYMSDGLEKTLSNLNYSPFIFCGKQFTSMEGFLQSLKSSDAATQEKLATLFGVEAWREGQKYNDWKKLQVLYFGGQEYLRGSPEYQVLLCGAYDTFFECSEVLRKGLYASLPFALDHKGKTDIRDSVLTKHEYLFQLYRLRAKTA